MRLRIFLFNLLIFNVLWVGAQTPPLYFPPKTGTAWAMTDPATLGWCQPKIDSLYTFLEGTNTKGFIILKDGKVVLEKYFGTFTQDSVWYWASAGKTLTAALVGIAVQENLLALDQKTSEILGPGWTSCMPAQEDAITVRHQLEMTTGLDDTPTTTDPKPNECTDPDCLQFLVAPGTRWAYHTGAYRVLQDVVAKAAGVANVNVFCKSRVLDKTGMKGLYVNDVFFSKTRDAARFGLLMLAKGSWDGEKVLSDTNYVHEMTNPSQDFNKSYGFLTWLNGQPSFMLPGLQFVFPSSLIPSAPADMYSALGKNDQKIHVVPSKNMVVVRLGNESLAGPTGLDVPIVFDQLLWEKINDLECSVATQTTENQELISIFPNPTNGEFQVSGNWERVSIFDQTGRILRIFEKGEKLTTDGLAPHFFGVKIEAEGGVFYKKLVVE